MNKLLIIVSLILAFGLGLVLGAIGTGAMARHRMARGLERRSAAMHTLVMERLDRELQLDPAQRPEVEKLLRQMHEELMQLRRKNQPEAEAIVARGIGAIKPLLRPDQQEKLERVMEKARQRWHQPGPPPGNHPPPDR